MWSAAILAANKGWPVAKAASCRTSSSAISSRSNSARRTWQGVARDGVIEAGLQEECGYPALLRRGWATRCFAFRLRRRTRLRVMTPINPMRRHPGQPLSEHEGNALRLKPSSSGRGCPACDRLGQQDIFVRPHALYLTAFHGEEILQGDGHLERIVGRVGAGIHGSGLRDILE